MQNRPHLAEIRREPFRPILLRVDTQQASLALQNAFGTCHARLGQKRRLYPAACRNRREDALRRAATVVILHQTSREAAGDAERIPDAVGPESKQPGHPGRDAERSAGRRILGAALVEQVRGNCPSDAPPKLVRRDKSRQELAARTMLPFRDRHERRDQLGSGMPMNEGVRIIVLERVAEGAVDECRRGNREPVAVPHDRCFRHAADPAVHLPDLFCPRQLRATDLNPKLVNENIDRARTHIGRYLFVGETCRELGKLTRFVSQCYLL